MFVAHWRYRFMPVTPVRSTDSTLTKCPSGTPDRRYRPSPPTGTQPPRFGSVGVGTSTSMLTCLAARGRRVPSGAFSKIVPKSVTLAGAGAGGGGAGGDGLVVAGGGAGVGALGGFRHAALKTTAAQTEHSRQGTGDLQDCPGSVWFH